MLKVTVYTDNVNFMIVPGLNCDSTLLELKEQVKIMFGVKEDDSNWRLRRYNRYEDSMLDGLDFTAENLGRSLGELNMKDQVSLIIEKKAADEVF